VGQQLDQARQQAVKQLVATTGGDETSLSLRAGLRSKINQLKAVTAPDGGAQQIDVATPAGAPVRPRPKKTATFAFVLTLLAGLLGALGLERFNRKATSQEALEDLFEFPMLASVPHVQDPAPVIDGKPTFSPSLREPMRMLRVNLNLQTLENPVKTILVTSAVQSEGKSTIVRNLALAMYEASVRVVIVEADLRRPSLAVRLGVEPGKGLTDVIAGDISLEDALVDIEIAEPDVPEPARAGRQLTILPGGSAAANPSALLGSAEVRALIATLGDRYDLVIIDSPPLLPVSDTLALLPLASGLILVGRVGLTTRDSIHRVKTLLGRSPGGRVIGIVADDVDVGSAGYGYGYGYGYGAASTNGRETKDPAVEVG
jgi:capsular exopolysaccharide synthesis family protein